MCRGSELVHSVPDDIYGAVPAAAEFEAWAQTRWEVSCSAAGRLQDAHCGLWGPALLHYTREAPGRHRLRPGLVGRRKHLSADAESAPGCSQALLSYLSGNGPRPEPVLQARDLQAAGLPAGAGLDLDRLLREAGLQEGIRGAPGRCWLRSHGVCAWLACLPPDCRTHSKTATCHVA